MSTYKDSIGEINGLKVIVAETDNKGGYAVYVHDCFFPLNFSELEIADSKFISAVIAENFLPIMPNDWIRRLLKEGNGAIDWGKLDGVQK